MRGRCLSRTSNSLQGRVRSAKSTRDCKMVIKQDLWPTSKACDVFKSTVESYETLSKLADHLWGNELAKAKCASDFSVRKPKENLGFCHSSPSVCSYIVYEQPCSRTSIYKEDCVMS